MLTAKEARKIFEANKNLPPTTIGRIEKQIIQAAEKHICCLSFTEDDFGKTEDEVKETIKTLSDNGFKITNSLFDRKEYYLEF